MQILVTACADQSATDLNIPCLLVLMHARSEIHPDRSSSNHWQLVSGNQLVFPLCTWYCVYCSWTLNQRICPRGHEFLQPFQDITKWQPQAWHCYTESVNMPRFLRLTAWNLGRRCSVRPESPDRQTPMVYLPTFFPMKLLNLSWYVLVKPPKNPLIFDAEIHTRRFPRGGFLELPIET